VHSTNDGSWRIVVFTDLAGPVLDQLRDLLREKGHDLVSVFTAPPPKSRPLVKGHLKVVEAAAELRIPTVVSSKRKQWPDLLQAFEPDLAIACMFAWRIPKEVFTLPRLGMFNVHIGQLPQYRGTNSVGWAFRNDEGELGTTAHWMAEDWDAGPVIARGLLPYGDDDDLASLMPGVMQMTFNVIDDALDRVAEGYPGELQDESLARNCPLFEPEWRQIDWNYPARLIHNQVRSWIGGREDQPRGAYGNLNGESTLIYKTRLEPPNAVTGTVPGQVINRNHDGIVVQCGDGQIRMVEWERAEG
jgi:methionyl-tRNA formyltransferase